MTTLAVICMAAFWLVNGERVRLSYLPQTSAGKLASYQSWEHLFVATTWYVALALVPPLLLQLVLWSKIRQATQGARGVAWVMLASTLTGLVVLALLGLAAGVSVGGGMVG